jgi:hypothetical protein
MITPPQSDVRINAILILEQGGVVVLRSTALKNIHNEELCKQIAEIIFKLTYLGCKLSKKLLSSGFSLKIPSI